MDIFDRASQVLAQGADRRTIPPDVTAALAAVGLDKDIDESVRGDRAARLKLLSRCDRFFGCAPPAAPGICIMGLSLDPSDFNLDGSAADLSGKAMTVEEAFLACTGEAVEYVSRLSAATGSSSGRASWRVHAPNGVPIREADLDRLLAVDVGRAASEGCASGVTLEQAERSAVLELIERDAVALWWRGGRAPRLMPAELVAGAASATSTARGPRTARLTWLLDITTDLDVPCAAALSCATDGTGLSAGFAARFTLEDAAKAAFIELCQMEFALHLAIKRRAENPGVQPGPRDARQLALADLDLDGCEALRTLPPRRQAHVTTWQQLTGRMAERGVTCAILDLTHPDLGVPCVRAVAPALQPGAGAHVTGRLLDALRQNQRTEPRWQLPALL